MRHTCSIALAGLVAWTLTGGPARAQFQAPLNSLEFSDDGTVEVVQENAIKIRDSKNDDWILEFNAGTTIRVTGDAEPEWLRPGSYVKFTGDIDKKGSVQKDIDEIEIITAGDKGSLGLFTPAEGDTPGKVVRNAVSGTYVIKGRLTKNQDGRILVLAGSRQVTGRLGEELAVKLNVDDHTLAQAGDTVKVKAWYFEKTRPVSAFNQPGRAIAEEVTITLARPLAYTGKKARSVDKGKAAAKPASKSSRVSK